MYLYTLPIVRPLKTNHTLYKLTYYYRPVKVTVHTSHFGKFTSEPVLLRQQCPTRESGYSLSQYMSYFQDHLI